ncbi:MAG: metallophosphoesterase [Defluviitaleaceae bacterium]|nr:metallophosphoesterase [Defluviitaleaceae bacterium]
MIYITGDTHRDFRRVEFLCREFTITADDVLVILGDAGINFFGDPQDASLKSELAQLPLTLLCIHGNHEMRPEKIKGYEEARHFGGVVYRQALYPNLLFAKCGETYELAGKKCLVLGGAYSVDKFDRLKMNPPCWWEDEQPSDEIKKHAEAQLTEENWTVDYVFSHTCPLSDTPYEDLIFSPKSQMFIDKSTEEWLESIKNKLTYTKWYCGHFHINKPRDKMQFLYKDIILMER